MHLLLTSKLFSGLNAEEIKLFLNNSSYSFEELKAKQQIKIDMNKSIFVIDGAITNYENTLYGNKRFINTFTPNGNVLMPISKSKSYPSVITEAKTNSIILLLDTSSFTQVNPSILIIQSKIQQNIIKIFYLMTEDILERSIIVSEASAKNKIMKYLLYLKAMQKQNPVRILLSRSDLASHLSIDTSTLMRELKALSQEGIIEYDRNYIKITGNFIGE